MSEIYHCSTHEKMCVLHVLLSWCASFSYGVNADENHRSVSFIGKYLVVKLLEFQHTVRTKHNSFLMWNASKVEIFYCKVWVFWEGHKIWKKSSSYFWQVDEDFSKQMWTSRIIQTLPFLADHGQFSTNERWNRWLGQHSHLQGTCINQIWMSHYCCHHCFSPGYHWFRHWLRFQVTAIENVQVNNYEIVINFFHISHNLTSIVHKFTRI